jgi:hypothetical protein
VAIEVRVRSLFEMFVGLSLALVLQTTWRLGGILGPGEIGLFLCVLIGLISGLNSFSDSTCISRFQLFETGFIIYLLMVLLPVTLINVLLSGNGASFRDWFAYMLSALFLFFLSHSKVKAENVGRWFLFSLVAIIFIQYWVGGDAAWYSNRFTGGANNPNQLALYISCAILISFIVLEKPMTKMLFGVVFLFFGYISLSDAFLIAVCVSVFVAIAVTVFPYKYFVFGFFVAFTAFLIFIFFLSVQFSTFFGEFWVQADEGGARLALYANGLRAWSDNLFSFFIGNGAGSFSGLTAPFQGAESHNTPIDVLASGGLLAFIAFYFLPAILVTRLYAAKERLLVCLLCGLVAFSLFHFVARHPVWWFSIYLVAYFVNNASSSTGRLISRPLQSESSLFYKS